MRRIALISAVVLAGVVLAPLGSRGATSVAPPSGLPLYQFVNSGSGPLPWNAVSLTAALNHTTMLGGPHSAANAAEGVIAYRTSAGDVDLYVQSATGAAQWSDLSSGVAASAPAADPIPFFDPAGHVDVLYVDALGHLILISPNDPATALWSHLHHAGAWRPEVATDLSALTGVTFANGLASVQVSGSGAVVAGRTLANDVEVIPLAWDAGEAVPRLSGAASDVTAATHASTATSDPVVLATPVPAVVTTSITGDFELFAQTGAPGAPWVLQDVTAVTSTAKVSGTLTGAASPTTVYAAALGANGNVVLFAAPISAFVAPAPAPVPWSVTNVTSKASGAPPLSGSLFLDATASLITVAGQAANWGDLFALTSATSAGPWVATDVSVTAGNAARTVGGTIAGFHAGTSLDLFAAGIASPPPQGVGVYAIPYVKWGQAVSDGWPILSETGALGTQAAPWVGFTSATSVATSPDFLMGQALASAHQRVTWLSFWTISGPLKGETRASATYYSHGFAAGAWVAGQIAQYRGLGVGLKPDWVILDPEGYPDNHSGLDAPAGSSTATIATYATYWSAMLQGWAKGLASVDPTLNAGIYASQSEYRNYQLASNPLPVFVALAFGGGGPIPVPGASGSNVRGFIAFSAVCTPTSKLASETSTLLNPPWGGQFNTLQFNAGVYCPPAPS